MNGFDLLIMLLAWFFIFLGFCQIKTVQEYDRRKAEELEEWNRKVQEESFKELMKVFYKEP